MSQNADSYDDEPPLESGNSLKRSYSNRENLSDSSKEEGHAIQPFKRSRRNTTGTATSSQSSSGSGDSDDSTSETEDVPRPSMSNSIANQFNDAPSTNISNISTYAQRIMMKGGYVEGKGLGKHSQGIVKPVEASSQRGRMGLGFQSISQGRKYIGPDWNPTMENVVAEETVYWMDESPSDQLDRDTLESWMVLEPKKLTIQDEVYFCDAEILQDILSLKTGLDPMTADQLKKARSQCNPFEKIAGVFFINRAALKMANMDAVFDYMFTEPKNEHGNKMVGPNDLLYFADVCAGPGGFTEYVLWRKKWRAKGFGFTLKKSNDFNLTEMRAASTSTFCPYYGVKKDGDIFDPDNLSSLKKFILKFTDGYGVHFLMGDGGFAVEGQENIQEILSKQLYLCQCVAALSCVREGGNFVVKLFDLFTEFSVGLVYLMYKSFRRVCIHKPNTSRPANSERYLICKGKRGSSDTIENHLLYINTLLWECTNRKTKDVTKLVPLEVIMNDEKFYKYICDSNNRIGEVQKNSLLKINTYHKNPNIVQDTKHAEMRTRSLQLWNIPDMVRVDRPNTDSKTLLESIEKTITAYSPRVNNEFIMKTLHSSGKVIENINLIRKVIRSPYDWNFVFKGSPNYAAESSHFYLGSPGNKSWKFEGRWIADHDVNLPCDTLVFAELVQEYRGEGKASFMTKGFHILDAICLGGECVFDKSLKERYDKIALFCAALNKPTDKDLCVEKPPIPLRCKKLYALEDLPSIISSLVARKLKNSQSRQDTTPVPKAFDNSDLYYVVHNILFLKIVKEPWTINCSKNSYKKYFYNLTTLTSRYDDPGVVLNSLKTLMERMQMPYTNTPLKNDLLHHIQKIQ